MKPLWLDDVDWQQSAALGDGSFRCGRLGADHVAEWTDVAVLRTHESGMMRELWTDEGIPPAFVEKLKRGAATAFVRAIRGELSWHAAAVSFDRRAVLLLGDSGAGKSTAAHSLCRDHRCTLLADDVAAICSVGPGIVIEPTESVVWLTGGSEPTKQPQQVVTATAPCSLMTAIFLSFEDSSALRSRPLGAAEAFQRLLDAMLRFIPSSEQWRREFDVIARMVEQAACFEVVRGKHSPADATAEYLMRLADANPRRLRGRGRPEIA